MTDLNVTLVEEIQKEAESNNTPEVKQEPQNSSENNDSEEEEKFPCGKCERIFSKLQSRNLHMSKMHNKKSVKYTPIPVKRKVGRPQTRFICSLCNVKLMTENELRSHISLIHNSQLKRDRSEKKTDAKGFVRDKVSAKKEDKHGCHKFKGQQN